MSRLTPIRVGVALLAVLLVAGVVAFRSGPGDLTVTASFPRAVGLYAGDDVRVVGVPVGTITKISAAGDHVEVTMRVSRSTPVAADTGAVIVPPGVLSARYVQLTRPWLSGPRLADGARIGPDRTRAPLELDDVTRQLNRFLTALGPQGAGADGALGRLVDASATALGGNGTALRTTLADLARALDAVGSSRGDIVATVEQLQTFVSALAGSDQAVRTLENGLGDVSTQLADQRAQLRSTVRNISTVVTAVDRFVRTNRGEIDADVALLTRLTTTLKDRERELTEIADLGAIGTEGIFGAANLTTGVLEARVDLSALFNSPSTQVCQVLQGLMLPQVCGSSVPSASYGSKR